MAVANEKVEHLVKPNSAPHSGVPPHGMAQLPIPVKEPPQRFRSSLQDHFDRFYRGKQLAWGEVSSCQDLVLVVPLAPIRLDHGAMLGVSKKGCPPVGCYIKELDLVWVIRQKLPETMPQIRPSLLLKPDDPGGHGEDAVLSEQLDRLPINVRGGTLANLFERFGVGVFHPKKEALKASFLIEMQELCIAHNIPSSG